MLQPLISIIIPAYNVEAYIKRTVDSVLCQTYRNFEIIIVDDGSNDSTAQVADELSQSNPEKVKVLHIPNGGVTKARLTGVSNAQGEWIGFVDSDDTIEPDMYQILIENALKYSADISHCGYKMMFDDGRVNYFHNSQKIIEHDTNMALKELLSGKLVEPGLWNKIYKKEVFDRFFQKNQMDYSIKINEDLLMNYILFSCSKKSVFYDVCKYNYIVRQSSASRSTLNDNKIYDPIKVKEHIMRLASQELKDCAVKAYLGTCINIYNAAMLSKNTQYVDILNDLRERIKDKTESLELLNKRNKILARMILKAPKVYRIVYTVYSNYFQEKKYD